MSSPKINTRIPSLTSTPSQHSSGGPRQQTRIRKEREEEIGRGERKRRRERRRKQQVYIMEGKK